MTRALPPRHQDITDHRSIGALASPVRQEIVDTLQALGGSASIGEIATQLGRPADGLYYHLRLLVRHGLVEELSDAGRATRRYRIRGPQGAVLRLRYRDGGRAGRGAQAVGRVIDGMLQIAGRDFHAALGEPDVVVEGEMRELWAARSKGWVNDRELAEINRLLVRLNDLLHRPRRAGRDRLASLCFVLAPVKAQPKRRGD